MHDDEDFDWMDFYREQFSASVDVNALETLKREYQGSDEETRDVLAAFEKAQGDLDRVYETVMLCNVLDDDERFRQIIDRAIQDGRVENFPSYAEESDATRQKRVKAAQKEAREAEKLAEEVEDNKKKKGKKGEAATKKKKSKAEDDNSLVAIIQQRQANRAGGFFDALEEKYAPKAKGNGKKRPAVSEPPEEAFAATAARKSKSGKKS